MAKIKPAGGRKPRSGPQNPGAVGCLILIAAGIVIIGIVLYYSLARS
ncbi:MAG: hypothetical protein HY858_04225 [Candidatus Solibacter usitatus]|nr:hypothetical protein [Candidatus Solibacter usitatus]